MSKQHEIKYVQPIRSPEKIKDMKWSLKNGAANGITSCFCSASILGCGSGIC